MIYAKKKAKEFAERYNVSHKNISMEKLRLIANDLHAKVLSYEQLDDNVDIEELIDSCNTDGITYAKKNGNSYLILYNGELSAQKAIYIIIHELAHIFLNHISIGVRGYIKYDSPQEREANVFACSILAPTKNLLCNFIFSKEKLIEKTYIPEEQADIALKQVLKIKSKSLTIAKIILLSLCVYFLFHLMYSYTQTTTDNALYYVTKHGEKYHRRNCQYLNGRKIKILSVSELKFYDPCKVCIESYNGSK